MTYNFYTVLHKFDTNNNRKNQVLLQETELWDTWVIVHIWKFMVFKYEKKEVFSRLCFADDVLAQSGC